MQSLNKRDHFYAEIDRMLSLVAGLSVLPIFNLAEWGKYKFPYAHTQLMDFEYEYSRGEGGAPEAHLTSQQRFVIYLGVESPTDTTDSQYIRKAVNAQQEAIEQAFSTFTFANYSNDNYVVQIESFVVDAGSPAASSGTSKSLTAIGGEIRYSQRWI